MPPIRNKTTSCDISFRRIFFWTKEQEICEIPHEMTLERFTFYLQQQTGKKTLRISAVKNKGGHSNCARTGEINPKWEMKSKNFEKYLEKSLKKTIWLPTRGSQENQSTDGSHNNRIPAGIWSAWQDFSMEDRETKSPILHKGQGRTIGYWSFRFIKNSFNSCNSTGRKAWHLLCPGSGMHRKLSLEKRLQNKIRADTKSFALFASSA